MQSDIVEYFAYVLLYGKYESEWNLPTSTIRTENALFVQIYPDTI